jgi:hypothetical protein
MLVAEESSQTGLGNVLSVGGWRNLFKRGDANGSGVVDISDAVAISDWVTPPGPIPVCLDGADANDDSRVDTADAPFLLEYLFYGGAAPPLP